MLSYRLIRMVSDHWSEIADRVLRQVQRDSKLLELGRLSEASLRERARDILQNLDHWMVAKEEELAERYEKLGAQRYEDGIPLHEMVYVLQLLKEGLLQYVRDQGFAQTPLELYAEEELQHTADRIFDTIIYYFVRGYERALREQLAQAERRPAVRRQSG